jgi:hypothetical protein
VAEQFLNCPDVGSGLEQVRRKRVTQRVACRPLGYARAKHGFPHRALYGRLVQVVTPTFPAPWIGVHGRGREDPLPFPSAHRARRFPAIRAGQLDTPCAPCEITLMEPLHQRNVRP